jgi:hypothetical protein
MTTVTSWAQLVATLVAIAALIVTTIYSRRSIDMSRRSVEVAGEALKQNAQQAWDYLGGQQCTAYRDQVLRLHELGCTTEQIKHWFQQEKASGDHSNAYEAFEDGCGSVEELTALLPSPSRRNMR